LATAWPARASSGRRAVAGQTLGCGTAIWVTLPMLRAGRPPTLDGRCGNTAAPTCRGRQRCGGCCGRWCARLPWSWSWSGCAFGGSLYVRPDLFDLAQLLGSDEARQRKVRTARVRGDHVLSTETAYHSLVLVRESADPEVAVHLERQDAHN